MNIFNEDVTREEWDELVPVGTMDAKVYEVNYDKDQQNYHLIRLYMMRGQMTKAERYLDQMSDGFKLVYFPEGVWGPEMEFIE